MFNYPNDFQKILDENIKIKVVKQRCTDCKKWFNIKAEKMNKHLDEYREDEDGLIEFKGCICSHCKERQYLILPGKYDKPFKTALKNCACQYVE